MYRDEDNEEWDDEPDINELIIAFYKLKVGEAHLPLSEEDFEMLIEYFESIGDKENEILACEFGIIKHPYSLSLLMIHADQLITQKKFGRVKNLLETMEQLAPNDIDVMFLKCDVLLETNKHDEAIKLLISKLEQFTETEQKLMILTEMADIYDEMADYDAVYKTIKIILNLNPFFEDALMKITFWADITEQLDDCIAFHTKILDEHPFYASAWYNLGLLYQSKKDYVEAIDAYEYCISIDHNYEFAYRNQSDCFIQLKKYDLAIETLEEHLQITKPEDVVLETLALCWERKKQFSKARHFYRKASQLNPEDDAIFFKIGETYTKEKQWDKAIKSYSVALRLNEQNVSYSLAMGNCLMEMELEHEAMVVYLNAVKLRPDIKSTWLALLRAMYKSGYFAEALQQILIAEEHCGYRAEFAYYKSGILLASGKSKEARIQLENAMDAFPKKLNVLNQLDKELYLHPIFAEIYKRSKKR